MFSDNNISESHTNPENIPVALQEKASLAQARMWFLSSSTEVNPEFAVSIEDEQKELDAALSKTKYNLSRVAARFGGIKVMVQPEIGSSLETERLPEPRELVVWHKDGSLFDRAMEAMAAKSPTIFQDEITDQAEEICIEVEEIITLREKILQMVGNTSNEDILLDSQIAARRMITHRSAEKVISKVSRFDHEAKIGSLKERIDKGFSRGLNRTVLDRRIGELHSEKELLEETINASPEAYYAYWGEQLQEAQTTFTEAGSIYETPSLKPKIAEIRAAINGNQPVFIHGETGTGKTELAKYISRQYYGKEARVVAGRKGLEISEVTESQAITRAIKLEPSERIARVAKDIASYANSAAFNELVTNQVSATGEDEKTVRVEMIMHYTKAVEETYANPLEIGSRLQEYYQAAERGEIVVIDEMNAIPHHTLIALNDLLTHQACPDDLYARFQKGEISSAEIPAQNKFQMLFSDREIVIAPGFGVIATGNWKPEDGINYVGRQKLDTAFLRRFKIIQHDYLPNPTQGQFEAEGKDIEEVRHEKTKAELYQMMCSYLLTPDLVTELPKNAFDDVERLAQVARLIQDAFSGVPLGDAYMPQDISGSGGTLKPEEVVRENILDLGKVIQLILKPWRSEGFRHPLDYYIFNGYISRSTARPQELHYLYRLFQMKDFFSDKEWPNAFDLSTAAQAIDGGQPVTAATMDRAAQNFSGDILGAVDASRARLYGNDIQTIPSLKLFSADEIVERVVGPAPKRTRYPIFARADMPKQADDGQELDPELLAKKIEAEDHYNEVEAAIITERKKANERQAKIAETIPLLAGTQITAVSDAISSIEAIQAEFRAALDEPQFDPEKVAAIKAKIRQINAER